MNLVILLTTMLFLTSCGGGSPPGESPHGTIPTVPVCKTGQKWDEGSESCLPMVQAPADEPAPVPEPEEQTVPQTNVEESLQPFTSEYSTRSGVSLDGSVLTHITLSDDFADNVIGSCWIFNKGTAEETREIKLNRIYWENQNEDDQRSLLFHELGHCVEDLGHTDGAGNGECNTQYEDDTVQIMDACKEPFDGNYIVVNQEDWQPPYTAAGGYSYWYVYHWNWWYRVFEHNGLYYERVNKYNLEDVFDRFFNK